MTNSLSGRIRPPVPVAIIALCAAVLTGFELILGIVALGHVDSVAASSGHSTAHVMLEAVWAVVVGLAILAALPALRSGRQWARALFAVVSVLTLVRDVLNLAGHTDQVVSVFGICINVAALVVLFGLPSSRAFFRSNQPAA